ncbi:MAG: AI-2E family transporter, partial [candidate division WS1 bacterium]|nr:AI-2E family transporter [candidate division WS1 bacterium]
IPVPLETRAKRNTAATITVVLFIVLALVLLAVVVTPLVNEIGQVLQTINNWAQSDLAGQIDSYRENVIQALPESLREQAQAQLEKLEEQLSGENFAETVQSRLADWGQKLLEWQIGLIVTVLSSGHHLLALLIVPVFAYYFLADASTIRAGIEAHVPPDARGRYNSTVDEVDEVMRAYVHTIMVVSAIIGVATAILLYFAGVSVFLTFGILAGLANMVPIVGAIVAVAMITIISLLQLGLQRTLLILAIYGLIELIVDRVVSPKLMAQGARLHPVAVLLALLVGAEFFGVVGVFIAVPVLAALRVIYLHTRTYLASGRHRRELDELMGAGPEEEHGEGAADDEQPVEDEAEAREAAEAATADEEAQMNGDESTDGSS